MNKLSNYRYIVILFIILETFSVIDEYLNLPDSVFMVFVIMVSLIFYGKASTNKQTLFLLLYFLVLLVNMITGSELVTVAWLSQEFLIPMSVLCIVNTFLYYRDFKGLNITTRLGLIIIFILSIPTIIALYYNPNILRSAITMTPDVNTATRVLSWKLGLVRYGVIHSLPFLFPILIYQFKVQKKLSTKALLFFFIAIEYYMLIRASYAIPLILSSASILLSVFISKNYKANVVIGILSFLLIVIVYNKQALIAPLNMIQPYFNETVISDKIDDIYYSIKYGESIGQVEARKELYNKSWDAFLKSPFLGNADASIAGEHSYFIDRLAYFGILGSLPFFLFLFYTFKRHYSMMPKDRKFYYLISIAVFIALGFIKNISSIEPFLYILLLLPGLAFYNKGMETSIQGNNKINQKNLIKKKNEYFTI